MRLTTTLMFALIMTLISGPGRSAEISSLTDQDCAQTTSDLERSDLGCPVDLTVHTGSTSAQAAD